MKTLKEIQKEIKEAAECNNLKILRDEILRIEQELTIMLVDEKELK